MKNSISIILGLTVIAGSLLTGVQASRDAYHNYLFTRGNQNQSANSSNSNTLPVRPFSERVHAWRQNGFGSVTQDQEKNQNAADYNTERNFRGSRENASFWADHQKERVRGPLKTMARREGPWQVVSNTRSSIAFNRVPNVEYGTSYGTEKFVVGIPDQFVVEIGEKSLTATNQNMTIVIDSIDNSCGVLGFFACGVGISENRNGHGIDKIQSTSRIERSTVDAFKFLQSNDVTPTYTESFTGVHNGENMYVTRYYVANGDTIYILEGTSPVSEGSKLIAYSKKVFNSFHIR